MKQSKIQTRQESCGDSLVAKLEVIPCPVPAIVYTYLLSFQRRQPRREKSGDKLLLRNEMGIELCMLNDMTLNKQQKTDKFK